MITKEQAMTCTRFKQLRAYPVRNIGQYPFNMPDPTVSVELTPPIAWRANGACKTWKRDVERFQLPVKHGLYNYGYITNDNAHLFEVA